MLSIIFSVLWTMLIYYIGYYFGYNNGIRNNEINIHNEKNEPFDKMYWLKGD